MRTEAASATGASLAVTATALAAVPGPPTHQWDPDAALQPEDVLITVVVPVFNEQATVARVVRRIRAVPRYRFEIIAVDDASTDGSGHTLATLAREGLLDRVITLPHNGGKGAALRAGFGAATGHVVCVQDADCEYDPFDLPRLIQPILDGQADAVVGSRFHGEAHRVFYFWHSVVNRGLTLLSNLLSGLNLSDMEVCSKAVRRDLLATLPLSAARFGIEPELVARLAQSRARIYEVAVSYAGRTYEEGKKIGWRDGVAAVRHILAYNMRRRAAPVRLPAFHQFVRSEGAGTGD